MAIALLRIPGRCPRLPFVVLSALLIGGALPGCVPSTTHADREALPLFDAHTHLNGDMTAETLIEWMDQAGVRKMALMPRHYSDDGRATDEQTAAYAAKYPDRFVAFIGGQRGDLWSSWAWTTDPHFLREAEAKLRTGRYGGLGEFILHHYGYNRLVPTTHQHISGDIELPADSPLMVKIADLAARYEVPVVIHAEAEPQTAAQMRRLLERSPRTRIVWAHNCGRGPAALVAAFLKAHPNLMCDLGQMAVPLVNPYGYGTGWPAGRSRHISIVQYPGGDLASDMRDLFEAFADRFTIGTDTAHPFQYPRYGDVIEAFRVLLSKLQPETARRIGSENAERLFGKRDPGAKQGTRPGLATSG